MRNGTRLQGSAALLGAAAFLALCSSSKNPVGDLNFSGTTAPPRSATVRIRSSGFEPNSVTVQPFGQVTFENRDAVAHQLTSSCAQLNAVSVSAGANRLVIMGGAVGSCAYQDQADANKKGTVDACREIGLLSCR